MARIHAGLWVDCKNCNSDWKPKKRDRKDRIVRYMGGEVSVDVSIRRQVAAELGDEEPNKDTKYALLQKYGAAAARIDRNVTKPAWQEEQTWKVMKGQFDKTVRGLVPPQQFKSQNSHPRGTTSNQGQRYPYRGNPTLDKGKYWGPKDSNSSRSSRPTHQNSNPTRTGTRRP